MPPHLIAVPPLEGRDPEDQGPPRDQVTFCSHCGARTGRSSVSRVCRRCEMGLLLHARPELAPGPGDAFVVCDADLRVCALSRGAEQLAQIIAGSTAAETKGEKKGGFKLGRR